jgi:hypothetical protein
LKWGDVEKLMISILSEVDIEIVICLDEDINAQGLEADMLKCIDFVSISRPALASIVQVINSNKINRFSEIMHIKGISKKKYEIIFSMCYQKVLGKSYIKPYTENLFEFTNRSEK